MLASTTDNVDFLETFAAGLIWQLVWVAVPLAAFALLFHAVERVVQRRLVQRFGWSAALWTGWIGTPIHEISHVLMCWVFGHRVESMALFEPDARDGRLGYVRHTYRRGNWWQEMGNFFIGLAPLAGGTTALLLLTWALYPGLVSQFFAPEWDSTKLDLALLLQSLGRAMTEFLTWNNLLSFRFWLFVYLVLCVTLHMAPSGSDYRGGFKGAAILLGLWLAINLLHTACGLSLDDWAPHLAPLWQLAFSLLTFAAGLAIAVAGLVYGQTMLWDAVR